MRALLRVLAPLLGLALAAAGALLVIEVVAAWVRPTAATGLAVPWPDWRAAAEEATWTHPLVLPIAVAAAVVGLLLVLVGLLARRVDVPLDGPTPEMTVTTSPRVLARLVGRRVRGAEDVAAASVTATRGRVSVTAQAWSGATERAGAAVHERAGALLDELPLRRRPRLGVSVQERKGPR